jgi:non-heme chloroperoxidase
MDRRNILTLLFGASAVAGAARAAPKPEVSRHAGSRPGVIKARDGANLAYRSWGEGPTILFVAAWALPSQAWQYQMAPLAEAGFRCVAFDRRGHGRSDDPGAGYDIDTLASDIAAVADALDLREIVLVGHSMGGAECVRYLTNHGSARVRRLVLVAPTTPCLGKAPDNPDGLDPVVFKGMRAAFRSDFPGIVGANLLPFVNETTSPQMIDWILSMMTNCTLQAVVECNRAFSTADLRAELPRIRMPTLIIQGDADASAPIDLTGRKTAALLPNARFEVYRGAPHGLLYTHMERLTGDLRTFAQV